MAFETIGTALYPFGKRPIARKWHLYPQYILGVLGLPLAVSGWAAIYFQEGLGLLGCMKRALPLSLMMFIWTLYYNTAYSYQDVADDRKLGVHSMYVLAGQNIHAFLVCLGVLVLGSIAWVLEDVESAWLWLSWMGVWTVAYLSQFRHFDPARPETGGLLHKQNVKLGVWTVFVCIVEVFLAAM
jgi:4-hydroxybenzoate polyprenyltransferase